MLYAYAKVTIHNEPFSYKKILYMFFCYWCAMQGDLLVLYKLFTIAF